MNQKPIILRMEEAKYELTQCVNMLLQKHELNCYLIEPMFAELYYQVQETAKKELAQAKAQVEEQMEAAEAASDNTK